MIVATAPITEATPTWVSLSKLVAETGISRSRLQTLAISGRIGSQVVPGESPKYNLVDAVQIVRSEAR